MSVAVAVATEEKKENPCWRSMKRGVLAVANVSHPALRTPSWFGGWQRSIEASASIVWPALSGVP
jgi:hypothetical protein